MKTTSFAFIIYIGTFFMAYAGFLFHKIDAAKNPHIEVAVPSNNDVKSAGLDNQLSVLSDAEKAGKAGETSDDVSSADNAASSNKARGKNLSASSMSHASDREISGTQAVASNAYTNFHMTQSDYTDTGDSEQDRENTVTSGYDSYLSVGAANAKPSAAANNFTVTTATASAAANGFTQISSDGSEFLPDGSSQEDLVNAQSKNPHVYSIEDYQQASIDCDNSFQGQSSQADLIYKLKGC